MIAWVIGSTLAFIGGVGALEWYSGKKLYEEHCGEGHTEQHYEDAFARCDKPSTVLNNLIRGLLYIPEGHVESRLNRFDRL